MKNILRYFAVLCAACMATGCGSRSDFSGRVICDRDSVLVQRIVLSPDRHSGIDTLILKDGYFEADMPDSVVMFLYVAPLPRSEREMVGLYPSRVLYLPGDRICIEGRLDDPQVVGSEVYDAYYRTEFAQLEHQRNCIKRDIQQLSVDFERNHFRVDSLKEEVRAMDRRLSALGLEAVKADPDNPSNGLILLQISAEECVEAAKYLGAGVRNGRMKPALDYYIGQCERMVLRSRNWDALKAGEPAPGFTLRDVHGRERSLEEFRGKYVVLDFWGIWCGWCVKEIPRMVEYYAKYRHKAEFVGIDFRDDAQKVLRFTEQKGMMWTNLVCGESEEVTMAYGVSAFPTKIIIDTEGRIVGKFVGESPAFYQRLDELLR